MLPEAPPTSWMDGHFLRTIRSSCSHNSSIGLRSGDCAGHSIIDRIPVDCFFPKQFVHSFIVWSCALGHCPVVGGKWLQLSAVHRVWHGVAKWIAFLLQDPFYPVTSLTLALPKHSQTITLPPPCLTDGARDSSSIFSASHKCCSSQNSLSITLFSNFPLSSVCVLLPILIFIFYQQAEMWLFLCNSAQKASIPESPLNSCTCNWCFGSTIL